MTSKPSPPAQEKKRFQPFQVPPRLLFSPGPTPVPPSVLQAMTKTVLGHLDPVFLHCMDEIKAMLQIVFETANRVTFPVSGTGSAGMEAAVFNAVEAGDDIVVCPMGVFGERLLAIIERTPAHPVIVRGEWGEPIEVSKIEAALQSCRPRALALVHAETSTGVAQRLEGLAELAHKYDALLIVDTVASLSGQPVGVDENQIDICYSGSQKCIGAPPGLAPITFSERALERLRTRRTPVQSWYFDVTGIEKYWGQERTYHHTAPISMNYALHEALRLICEEGLEGRWARHELAHRALVAGLEAMNIQMLVTPEHRAVVVNAVCVPEGVDGARVRARLLEEHNLEVAGGLGQLRGKIWRVGLMGESSRREHLLRLLDALHQVLQAEGYACDSGLAAAEQVYAAS
ncbi:MAG: alanine--glyoxylate aminotransferase family protein [Acidobacteria bacterium]|nr:alanine--glyoxylate aminotransferase family protein [Acidobacteriota bacterium]